VKFQQILADPGWFYNDRRMVRRDNPDKKPKFGIGVARRYTTMKTEDIAKLPVDGLAADVCHLHLWTTGTHLPDALFVMGEWGFSYKTIEYVWVKTNRSRWDTPFQTGATKAGAWMKKRGWNWALSLYLRWLTFFGPGFYTGSNVEFVLLGTTKKVHEPVDKTIPQLIFAPVSDIHSRKPYDVYEGIEAQYPNQSYIELFATEKRPGWACLGDAIDGRRLEETIPEVASAS